MIKNVKFELIAMDKDGIDYVDLKSTPDSEVGKVWIESEVMDYDTAHEELIEIYQNKFIKVELLKWQNQLTKSKIQEGDSNFTRFLAEEIQKRFFDNVKPKGIKKIE